MAANCVASLMVKLPINFLKPLLVAMCLGFSPSQALGFELLGFCLIGSCDGEASAADVELIDPKRYQLVFDALNTTPEVETALKAASELWRGQDAPVGGSAGVIARAKGDYQRILAALYNQGYYGSSISIVVEGRQASDVPVGAEFANEGQIIVSVEPGLEYTFGRTIINGAAPISDDPTDQLPTLADVAFAQGLTAKAGNVGKAAKLARDAWRQLGHPLAKITDRRVTANHPQNQLNVELDVDSGPRATYGTVEVRGTTNMDPEFVARQTGLQAGQEYDPDDLERARKRLDRLGVFSVRKLEEGEALDDQGALPLLLSVDEQKLRRIGAGATLSSIDGLGLEGYWLHRNLFGKAERLRLDAKISGLGATLDYQKFDYDVGAAFTKPGVLMPDIDFNAKAYATRTTNDAFTDIVVGGKAFLTNYFSDQLTLTGGTFAEYYRFENSLSTEDFLTAGFLASAAYDARDNKLDPTTGFVLNAEIKPFYEFNFGNTGARSTAEVRGYLALTDDDRAVLAGRAMIGSVIGPSRAVTPDNMLFFAGGGGSVRGYGFNNIGITEPSGTLGGGKSKIEASAELRLKVTDNLGGVVFADAGMVSADLIPSFSEDLKIGVGAGIRYFTGLGPIRLDAAIPLDKGPSDPDFGIYAGIGQAF